MLQSEITRMIHTMVNFINNYECWQGAAMGAHCTSAVVFVRSSDALHGQIQCSTLTLLLNFVLGGLNNGVGFVFFIWRVIVCEAATKRRSECITACIPQRELVSGTKNIFMKCNSWQSQLWLVASHCPSLAGLSDGLCQAGKRTIHIEAGCTSLCPLPFVLVLQSSLSFEVTLSWFCLFY